MRVTVGALFMRHVRADHGDESRGATALRIVGHDEGPPRPAWRILAWTIALAMALWAAGILELPASARRLADWIGGLTVLAVLVGWVRANARSLAAAEQHPERDDRVRVRVIRSRRPPLASVGGPDLEQLPRRPGRVRSS